ncbi:MAG: hypothetical protein ABEI75_01180 [Halobaculum sp.]
MQTRAPRASEDADGDEDRPVVRACESRPGRTVLLESDNPDGWIASELVVETESFR